jgi:Phage P22-like portal protein
VSDDQTESKEQPDVLDRALMQFNEITSASRDERMMALEDRRFVFIQGAAWEGDWGAQFENTLRVAVNKVGRGHDKIINDYRANRFTINFRPVSGKGTDDTAELLNGLLFADMHRSKGQQALDNAFNEGASGGMGAFQLINEYEDESDPDNDHQRICIDQVVDADQRVFFDLDAKLYDKSDARFAYVMHSMTVDAFKREYGDNRITSWPENKARANWFDWFRPTVVYIAEYFEVENVRRELRIYSREATGEEFRYWAEDMDDEMVADLKARGFSVRSRKIKRKRVHKWILSGAEVLEDCGYIAGSRIPIIPFYGKRVFIDNVERFKGHVRDAKDPQRLYNAQISKLAETASLAAREVPIFAPEQMHGLQDHWANMNLDKHPYALAHPLLDPIAGGIVQAGPSGMIKPPDVPPVIGALIQQTGADIAEITNGDDGSMEIKSNVSGEAMDIAASRVDAKSFIYMDNFKLTMQAFGEVYEGMAREVYVEEGREVETMDEDGQTDSATLHELHTDPASGVTAKRYDLSVGKFNVVAEVTEATTTRRDKTVRTMMTIAQAAASIQAMDVGQAALLTALKNMDGEGIGDLKDWVHKKAVSMGLDEMTPEEQQQAQQQQQQPDPQAEVLAAQADALKAQTGKFVADTEQSKAKTVLTLAQAHKTNIDAHMAPQQAAQDHVNNLMRGAA